MTGQARLRGRPAKTESLAFQLLALAAHARHLSQDGIAARVNGALDPDTVSQPTVGKWLRDALPDLVDPSVAIRRPDDLGLRVACLLFRRKPADALKLVKRLAAEPLVSRVEQWRGETNVFAEVVVLDSRDIDKLVARYKPDSVYEVVERIDAVPDVLEHLGRQVLAR
jgi:hypothetical protein